jgi:sugar (pentulose or hexulose) kinase
MVGGAAHSPHWPQILADVNSLPVLLSQYRHGPALGAAILAFESLGLIDELPGWVSARRVTVNRHHAALYDQYFAAYQQAAVGGKR